MQELLESRGFAVEVASNGEQALQIAAGSPRFDLVITDQTMPRLTGTELAQALQSTLPKLPVIRYTGHSDPLSDTLISELGIRACLKKPVDIDEP